MLNPGTRFGPYEILASAGAGGMGEVYRARDSRLERTVALKLLPAHLAGRADLRERFQTEARAVARLQHANICAVFDVGAEDGVDYLILEYLEGETLEKQLERGPLPLSDALRIGAQIAAGLDAAHRAGIVHRDLKPGNVMLTKSGAKLLDFGLAKVTQPSAPLGTGTAVETMTRALTVEGAIMGTFQYMAPEQLEGREADPRTDIFAFGLVLYEMVTGQKAFQGKSQATMISAIMSADPAPVAALQPSTPPALERVILRCIAKDPDERWQTARDLCRELEWIALGGSQVGIPAPVIPRRPSRLPWALAAAGLLAAIAVSSLYLRRPAPSAALVARFSVPIPPSLRFLAGPAISPDGSVAAVWLGENNGWQIYIYTLATGELRPLPNSANATMVGWSPDSRYVVAPTANGGDLRKIDIASGAVTILTRTTKAGAVAWSRAGVILYFGDGRTLSRIPAEGGPSQPVLTLKEGETAGSVQFLPDPDHILMSVYTGSVWETRLASLRDGSSRFLMNDPAVSVPGGRLLFVHSNALLAQSLDPGKGALTGAPVTIASNVYTNLNLLFSASENGVVMFHRYRGSVTQELTWCDRSGKKLGTVGVPDQYSNPAISPDGKRLAVGLGEVTAKLRDIWVYDLTRGGSYRLTFDPADDFNPVWSPDGRYLAFSSNRRGKRDIYRKLASGTGDDELLYATATEDKNIEGWSPDGKFLWFNFADPKTRNDIYQLSLEDHKAAKYIATPFNEDHAALSPDGRWLAYRSQESNRDEVYLQPYPATGERWQVSTAGGNEPMWRADGKELFFVAGNTINAVDIKAAGKTVEIGIPHALFEAKLATAAQRNRYAPAADGQKFLVIWQQEQVQATSFDTIVNWPGLLHAK